MSTTINHSLLASLAVNPASELERAIGDPTFWVVGGTFLAAIFLAVVVMLVRFRCPQIALSGGEKGGGLVDVSHFRAIDLIGVGWVVGIYLWMSLAGIAAAGVADEERVIGMADLWVSIGFQCVMAGMVVLVMAPRVRAVVWLGLRRQGWRSLAYLAPISVVGMWLAFGVLEAAGYTKWLESLGVDTVQDSVRALQKRDDAAFLVLMRFSAVIVAPICEEVIFRGYLYGVAKRYCGPIAAALCTALIFAAAHASLVALLPLALFGLLLAWLYERTGSIWAPIAAHACFNAATVVHLMMR